MTKEFTPRAVILGIILGLIFGVGNAYLGLKVGMTVSASIPAAVMSMAFFKLFAKGASILENNMVQTIASAGEALAPGIVFTVPALMILGGTVSIFQVFLLSILGGGLGVLMMIPLRHHLIVVEHDSLPYPEGTACATILRARTGSRHKGMLAFVGILLGAVDQFCMGALHLWSETITFTTKKIYTFTVDTAPALFSVGYLIGPRYALVMFSGGMFAWWVLIPLIVGFGLDSIVFPAFTPIKEMSTHEIWETYVRYIGTGAVAVAGLVSLIRLAPTLYRSLHGHMKGLIKDAHPTSQDLSFKWVIGGVIVLLGLLWALPTLNLNFVSVVLILVLGFLVVGLTSITCGLVGASSNPASGMIILSLLVTCLVFVAFGWTSTGYLLMAMTVGCVVGIAITVATDISQDLKTGYLVGATPRWQQIGMLIGIVLPAMTMGGVLLLLQETYGFGSQALPAPQATLMAIIVKGVIEMTLPFGLVLIGIVIALAIELLGVRSLPLALGIYLPFSTSTAIAIGGILHWIVKRKQDGVLLSSGLVAGDAVMGVVVALLAVSQLINAGAPSLTPGWVSLIIYIVVIGTFLTLLKGREEVS